MCHHLIGRCIYDSVIGHQPETIAHIVACPNGGLHFIDYGHGPYPFSDSYD